MLYASKPSHSFLRYQASEGPEEAERGLLDSVLDSTFQG